MSQAQYPPSSGYAYGPGQGYQQNYQQPGQPQVGFAPEHECYGPPVHQQDHGPLSSQLQGGMQGQNYGSFHGSFSGKLDRQDAPPPSAPPADMFPHLAGYEDVQFGSAFIPPPPAYVPPSYTKAPEQRFAQSASISEEQARDAMLQFVSEHCCYGKTPAQEMAIRDIHPSSFYHYSLTSFCESRKTEWKYAPYQGQPIDSPINGPAPLPWDIPVQPPQMFSDFKTVIEVPHTANIKPCHDCLATGYRPCHSTSCEGTGRMQCRACDGSGRVSSLDTSQCTNCMGRGVIVCTMCKGVGRMTCRTCNGHAQLKTFIEMTVKWENHTSNHVVGQTGLLPAELIVNSQGTEIFSEELPRVWPITNFFDQQINEGSKRLVGEHSTKWPTQRIILQRQLLRAVPVSEVHYEWMDTPSRFWVYGHDHKVYAPDYPQRYCCGCSIL